MEYTVYMVRSINDTEIMHSYDQVRTCFAHKLFLLIQLGYLQLTILMQEGDSLVKFSRISDDVVCFFSKLILLQ